MQCLRESTKEPRRTIAQQGNEKGTWARWLIGILVGILVAVLFGLGASAFTNSVTVAEHGADIKTLKESLKSMDGKLDRLLERTSR